MVTVFVAASPRSTLLQDDWRLQARCRSVPAEVFYPPDRETPRARRQRETLAKQICRKCPVQDACRRFAVGTREPHGVWGGTTPLDRRRHLADGKPQSPSLAKVCMCNGFVGPAHPAVH